MVLEESVAKAAVAAARRSGLSLSAWMNSAAAHVLAVESGVAAVAQWEAEHGALTADELAAADEVLDRGLGIVDEPAR